MGSGGWACIQGCVCPPAPPSFDLDVPLTASTSACVSGGLGGQEPQPRPQRCCCHTLPGASFTWCRVVSAALAGPLSGDLDQGPQGFRQSPAGVPGDSGSPSSGGPCSAWRLAAPVLSLFVPSFPSLSS